MDSQVVIIVLGFDAVSFLQNENLNYCFHQKLQVYCVSIDDMTIEQSCLSQNLKIFIFIFIFSFYTRTFGPIGGGGLKLVKLNFMAF